MYEELEQREEKYVRGKVAGDFVLDRDGNEIVSPGMTITSEVIRKCKEAGQLHYLMISAASTALKSHSPHLDQMLMEFREVTEGHEANFVRGRKAGRDVRDYQGNLLIREGEVITEDLIEDAITNAMLQQLVLAVGAPGLSMEHEQEMEEEEAERQSSVTGSDSCG
ncbi:MAG TPA: hypothetical protein VGK34_07665 [Armatimonadota bacterium]